MDWLLARGAYLLGRFVRHIVVSPGSLSPSSPSSSLSSADDKLCRSHFERRVLTVLRRVFPPHTEWQKIRPDWLRYPRTNRCLELDFYTESLGRPHIGVEVQGPMHRVYLPSYHKTRGHFRQQVARDRWKARRCKERGVLLIVVPDTESRTLQDIEACVRRQLPP